MDSPTPSRQSSQRSFSRRQLSQRSNSDVTVTAVPQYSPLDVFGPYSSISSSTAATPHAGTPHTDPMIAGSITEEPDDLTLTPLRAHYLKRELVTLQFTKEFATITSPEALSYLGPPFLPQSQVRDGHPIDKAPTRGSVPIQAPPTPVSAEDEAKFDLPFLKFFFRYYVLTFPFLKAASSSFYSHKVQPFAHSFFSRNFSESDERDEDTKRKKIAGKLEKHFGLLLSSAIKVAENEGKEEVIRVVSMAGPGEGVTEATEVRHGNTDPPEEEGGGARGAAMPALVPVRSNASAAGVKDFEINVVSVRNVVQRGRLRNKTHEEFIIRTRRLGTDDVFVSKRYGDFSKLAEELRTEFPESDVRPPPPKDRRTVEARAGSIPNSPAHSRSGTDEPYEHTPKNGTSTTPGSAPSTRSSFENGGMPGGFGGTPADIAEPNGSTQKGHSIPSLARERNRLTLRAYLHHLLGNPLVASSTTLRDFLLDEPIVLSEQEKRDVEVREEMDRMREEEGKRFKQEVEDRVRDLDEHLRGFRDELVKRDGLTRVFGLIKETPTLDGLPIQYRKVMEWARISLASTIYQIFVGSDSSSSVFQQMKRIHGMMPYFVLRGILRISNPMAMIRSTLDLFLARPFGRTSLLQMMFSSQLNDEVKELKEDMEKVAAKVEDDRLVQKVKNYVNAPKEIQQFYKADAAAQDVDLMLVILQSPEEPQLDRAAFKRIRIANQAYLEYLEHRGQLSDSDEDEGPTNDDAWLFEDLHVLMRLARRLRDKEQMIELIFEGGTSDLLKDIISIFYEPLAKVYRAANIADSIYDLQMFLNDLIKTVEEAEEQHVGDPQKTVQVFIDLVARHEGSFYKFVHQVHAKGDGLFDNLMRWIELFINLVRDGLPDPVPLEFLLPAGGKERSDVLAEVDAIVDYHRELKLAHHERMQRRMLKGDAEMRERDEDAAFVEGVMRNLQIGGVAGDVGELNAEYDDEDEDEDEDDAASSIVESVHEEGSPRPSDAAGAGPARPSLTLSTRDLNSKPLPSVPQQGQKRKKKKGRKVIEPPDLVHIPKFVPVFVEMLRPMLNHPGVVMGNGRR